MRVAQREFWLAVPRAVWWDFDLADAKENCLAVQLAVWLVLSTAAMRVACWESATAGK